MPMLAPCAALQLCQVMLRRLGSGRSTRICVEGHSSSCLISAESKGAMLGRKRCAGEPSLPLTLPSKAPAAPWLCATSSPQFSSDTPAQRGVSAKFGVSGRCGVRAPRDLEGPPGAAALTWLPSGPWAHQPQPCLASGLCSAESEMCYLLLIEKGTECLILTSDRQICCGEVWLEYTHTPV